MKAKIVKVKVEWMEVEALMVPREAVETIIRSKTVGAKEYIWVVKRIPLPKGWDAPYLDDLVVLRRRDWERLLELAGERGW